jgi:hypothetical protein
MHSGGERRAALATRKGSQRASCRGERGHEERVELVEPLLDQEDVTRALDEELGAKAIAADHLDGETAHVANLDFAAARK